MGAARRLRAAMERPHDPGSIADSSRPRSILRSIVASALCTAGTFFVSLVVLMTAVELFAEHRCGYEYEQVCSPAYAFAMLFWPMLACLALGLVFGVAGRALLPAPLRGNRWLRLTVLATVLVTVLPGVVALVRSLF